MDMYATTHIWYILVQQYRRGRYSSNELALGSHCTKWSRSCFQFLPTSPKHASATTTHWPVILICSCHKWWLSWKLTTTLLCQILLPWIRSVSATRKAKKRFSGTCRLFEPVTGLSSLWHSCHATITSKSFRLHHTIFLFLLSSSPHYLCISWWTFRSMILQAWAKKTSLSPFFFEQPDDRRRRRAGR